ncbi:hypothetical protein OXB_2254 [Bacillus sp. OxB-1]|nr:hypothetical protein OXB_2254 [Bacillus sp. OxB-1]
MKRRTAKLDEMVYMQSIRKIANEGKRMGEGTYEFVGGIEDFGFFYVVAGTVCNDDAGRSGGGCDPNRISDAAGFGPQHAPG